MSFSCPVGRLFRLLKLMREMFGPHNVNWSKEKEDHIEISVDSNLALLDPSTLVRQPVGCCTPAISTRSGSMLCYHQVIWQLAMYKLHDTAEPKEHAGPHSRSLSLLWCYACTKWIEPLLSVGFTAVEETALLESRSHVCLYNPWWWLLETANCDDAQPSVIVL